MFRGTNVKDAYDARLLVSEGVTKIKDSQFFISTHIVEVAEELEKNEGVEFLCFESFLKGDRSKYNYRLIRGRSSERMGLSILKNENIMSIIENVVNN